MSGSRRGCPFCGAEEAWGEVPPGCEHYLGQVAAVGGRGRGPRLLAVADLLATARRVGALRLRDLAEQAPWTLRELLDSLAEGEAWWTRMPGTRALQPPPEDLLAPADWFLGNPAAMGVLEDRATVALRWLEDRAA